MDQQGSRDDEDQDEEGKVEVDGDVETEDKHKEGSGSRSGSDSGFTSRFDSGSTSSIRAPLHLSLRRSKSSSSTPNQATSAVDALLGTPGAVQTVEKGFVDVGRTLQ